MGFNPLDSIVQLGGKILDKVIPDKDKANEAKIKMIELAQQGELNELNRSYDAIVAEANSSDKWTSRARPSFMYVMYIMILSAIPMGIIQAIDAGVAKDISSGIKAWLDAIPSELWGLFGVGYVGYSASRSYDKFVERKHK